jgi:hypothetical protein
MSLPPSSFERLPVPAHQAVARVDKALGVKKNASAEPGVPSADTAKSEGKEFSFWDLVDIVNPLQHIPVVSTIYRKITGDEIGNFARIAGGAVFGGFLGAAAGGVNALVASETGKDIGEMVLDSFTGDDKAETHVAAQDTPVELASYSATSAPSPSGNTGALFDSTAKGKAVSKIEPKDEKPPIPVIEVRPIKKNTMPVTQEIDSLPDFSSAKPAASDDKVTNAKDKAAIQRAMLDALLKMQELDKSASDDSTQPSVADGLN